MYGDKYIETPEQKERMRLILALMQVDNITNLLKDNEWKQFIYSHLSSIKYELERQLTITNQSANITEEKRNEQ